METWRFLLAVILAMAVVLLTNVLFPPAPRPEEGAGVDTVTVERPAEAPAETAREAAAPEERDTFTLPRRAEPFVAADTESVAAPADTVPVVSELSRLGVSTRGASIVSVELLRFESFTRDGPVQLVDTAGPPLVRYRLDFDGRELDLSSLSFTPSERAVTVGAGGGDLLMRYRAEDSPLGIELRYIFHPERYVVEVEGRLAGIGGASPTLLLDFGPQLAVNEADSAEDLRALGYVVNKRQEGIENVALSDVEAERIEEGPLSWVALKNKYFLLAALAGRETERDFGGLIARPAPGENAAELTATLPVREGAFEFRLYLGPQDYGRLAVVGRDLENANPYGWRIFRPIIRPLAGIVTWALTGLHNALGLAYGWVLILFGVLIQVILWPLNVRAMRSQMKTMELQPRIKEMQEKYKNDQEKLQKEMMRLYKEEGFNPLGGCLPMLIPWPVLITLFFVFQNTIEFRGVEFLWLPDLSLPDPYYILPVALGASIFIMQWLSMRTAPQQNPQMKMMMYFMPIMMVVIFLNLASGLNLYYAASNMASVPRQVLLVKERRAVREKLDRKKKEEEG